MLLAWDVPGKRRGDNDILPLLLQQHQAHLHDVWKVHSFCDSFILSGLYNTCTCRTGLNWIPLGCGRGCFCTTAWKTVINCFINCLFALWSTRHRTTGGASCFCESQSDAEPRGVRFPWLLRPDRNSKRREIKVTQQQLVPPSTSFACITLSKWYCLRVKRDRGWKIMRRCTGDA